MRTISCFQTLPQSRSCNDASIYERVLNILNLLCVYIHIHKRSLNNEQLKEIYIKT